MTRDGDGGKSRMSKPFVANVGCSACHTAGIGTLNTLSPSSTAVIPLSFSSGVSESLSSL